MLRRRTLLIILIASLAPAFLLTRALVAAYRRGRQELAVAWAARGTRDLTRGRSGDAVDDYRTALAFAREHPDYRLRLAQALLASDRREEAEAHLLTLWSEQPGSGIVNLELARIAAARSDVSDATRYYHAAIDGAWNSGAQEARRTARFELADILIAARQNEAAQAELTALAGNQPSDPALLTRVGEELVRAGADVRALAMFRRALALDGRNAQAARLAGQTAFRLGDYASARRDLELARREGALDAGAAEELDLSARVLALDPFARGISLRERARRTLTLFDTARDRLDRCRAQGPQPEPISTLADAADDLAPKLKRRTLARDDDLLDQALDLALRIESVNCGAATVDDRAVEMLTRRGAIPR